MSDYLITKGVIKSPLDTNVVILIGIVAEQGGKKEEAAKIDTASATASTGALVVKIGHASPLTGPQAHLGKDNENGVRMAIEELNAKGVSIAGQKVQFELLSEDDQADPRIATTVAQKFVDDTRKFKNNL